MQINENDVKNSITKWLNVFGCDVWWERRSKDYPEYQTTFKIEINGKLTQANPDLLIKNRKGEFYLCETKNGGRKKNVYDALFQVLRYATNDIVCLLEGEIIDVNGFMVATQHSLYGRLFEAKYDVLFNDFSEGRAIAINTDRLPRSEHLMTEQFSRILWRGSSVFGCKHKIGVLLSNVLNEGTPEPLFLYKQEKLQGFETWR